MVKNGEVHLVEGAGHGILIRGFSFLSDDSVVKKLKARGFTSIDIAWNDSHQCRQPQKYSNTKFGGD
jgi:hypothetical protein